MKTNLFPFQFRVAISKDAENVSALIALFAGDFIVNPDGSGAEQFLHSVSAQAEAGYIADPRYHFILAFAGEQLAGLIAMRDLAHLFHLFVHPDFQGRGLATELWRRAHLHAVEHGHGNAHTVNSSLNAIPVYERFGFTANGEVTVMHGISFLPMRLQKQIS
ncbi:GNAT family N-acetyltransferase [Undibacterium sp. TJN19]|uniref:GNAT family N-acetyltransferase n=1 Tax=Undibacterium sp. TJN19 TaxID=3413055 RepID=UPI003BF33CE5